MKIALFPHQIFITNINVLLSFGSIRNVTFFTSNYITGISPAPRHVYRHSIHKTKYLNIMQRCFWVNSNNQVYVDYHDHEWGVPSHDDKYLFEMLLLECFQAGLSWECILNKRAYFKLAYDDFNPHKIANYSPQKISLLLNDKNIIRNRLKILASINNSKIFLDIQQEFGTFDRYIWKFSDYKVVYEECDKVTSSKLSDEISSDLKRRGMRFVGSTTIYSYLQAIGIINGHTVKCEYHHDSSKA